MVAELISDGMPHTLIYGHIYHSIGGVVKEEMCSHASVELGPVDIQAHLIGAALAHAILEFRAFHWAMWALFAFAVVLQFRKKLAVTMSVNVPAGFQFQANRGPVWLLLWMQLPRSQRSTVFSDCSHFFPCVWCMLAIILQ
jgi:hypothetical protein